MGRPVKRPCLDSCGRLTDRADHRCEHCAKAFNRPRNQARDARRGTATARGYGTHHQQLRATWQTRIDAGQPVTCWRCRQPIQPGEPWDLGHDDQRQHRGPEHQVCNRAAGGRSAHNPLATSPTNVTQSNTGAGYRGLEKI